MEQQKQSIQGSSKERFLDAAEYLFAEYGYEGAKIRAIADLSKVNLGALHHYWGSKEELFAAVCKRRLEPMNNERLRLYEELVQADNRKTGKSDPCPLLDIKALFRASLVPTFFLEDLDSEEQIVFRKFYGRALTEPSPVVAKVMMEIFIPASQRFFELLRVCCPHLDDDQFYWRCMGILGTYMYAPAFSERIQYYAPASFDMDDVDTGLAQIVEFLAAGMLAPGQSA
jgi:AcrR family transcriptional regulator